IEQLHSRVLTVAHQHAVTWIDPHVVRQRELARAGALRTPRADEPAVGAEAMDAPLAVAIRDVQLPVRSDHRASRLVEWRARRAGYAGCTPRLQELAVQGPLRD